MFCQEDRLVLNTLQEKKKTLLFKSLHQWYASKEAQSLFSFVVFHSCYIEESHSRSRPKGSTHSQHVKWSVRSLFPFDSLLMRMEEATIWTPIGGIAFSSCLDVAWDGWEPFINWQFGKMHQTNVSSQGSLRRTRKQMLSTRDTSVPLSPFILWDNVMVQLPSQLFHTGNKKKLSSDRLISSEDSAAVYRNM